MNFTNTFYGKRVCKSKLFRLYIEMFLIFCKTRFWITLFEGKLAKQNSSDWKVLHFIEREFRLFMWMFQEQRVPRLAAWEEGWFKIQNFYHDQNDDNESWSTNLKLWATWWQQWWTVVLMIISFMFDVGWKSGFRPRKHAHGNKESFWETQIDRK